jgi:hypothetical protein
VSIVTENSVETTRHAQEGPPTACAVCLDNIPEFLIREPRWVNWRYGLRAGKYTKMPYQVDGKCAESDNPSTWNTFDNVVAAYKDQSGRRPFAGIGFMLGDGFAGIDLDNSRDPETGAIKPWAQKIIDAVRASKASPAAPSPRLRVDEKRFQYSTARAKSTARLKPTTSNGSSPPRGFRSSAK